MPPTEETERKFINPTPGWVGASKLDGDGRWTSVPVEPNGGAVWLTPVEERKTAEATRLADDNPFVKEWEEPVEWDGDGQVTRTVTRKGMLVLAPEGARPIASDRFIPSREGETPTTPEIELSDIETPEGFKAVVMDGKVKIVADESQDEPGPEPASEPEPAEEETQTGAPPIPEQPPVEGQPSPDEIVGTPDAVAANDKALAERESTPEQPTRPSEAIPV